MVEVSEAEITRVFRHLIEAIKMAEEAQQAVQIAVRDAESLRAKLRPSRHTGPVLLSGIAPRTKPITTIAEPAIDHHFDEDEED